MAKKLDLSQRIVKGYLTQAGQAFYIRVKSGNGMRQLFAVFDCKCGNRVILKRSNVMSGSNQSCGCRRSEVNQDRAEHGMTDSVEFSCWRAMLDRCYRKNHHAFHRYGGRGITVCDRWKNSFSDFFADMGPRPEGTSIGRIDNEKGYEPNNCRWETRTQQQRNMSTNVCITISGVTKCAREWALDAGIKYTTFLYRIGNGMTPEEAISKPVGATRG